MHDDHEPTGVPTGPAAPPGTIYTQVRDRICLLVYPPGTMLSENKLAREFGVSRTPIRKVLQALEFDGLVESRHGVGTMVTSLDLRELKQVYALRLKLIDLIAELPPGTVSDDDIVILDRLLTRAETLRDGDPAPAALAAAYQSFHQQVSRVIENRPLREISDRYFYQTARVWLQMLPEMAWRQEADAVAAEIAEVRDALRDKDLRRVSETRRRHFQGCLRRMNAVLVGLDLVGAVLPPPEGR